jgi:hypothetical protein
MRITSHLRLCLPFLIPLVLLSGCHKKAVPLAPAQSHMMKVIPVLSAYRVAHGKAPHNTEEFANWVKKMKPDELQKLGVDSAEDALTSPRDHEPYQVAPPRTGFPGPQPVLIYEKVGVNGKHMIVSGMGTSGEVTEEALHNAVPSLKK